MLIEEHETSCVLMIRTKIDPVTRCEQKYANNCYEFFHNVMVLYRQSFFYCKCNDPRYLV